MDSVDIEHQLCGSDHAEIGAELLERWSFPPDMVASVRYHHAPCLSDSPIASMLYIAEVRTGEGEQIADEIELALALKYLNIQSSDLDAAQENQNDDLVLLRFAA